MSNYQTFKDMPGRNRPWPDQRDLRKRRKWRRTYAVLCYCSLEGPERANPWRGGKRQWRRWRLLDIKQFKTVAAVQASHSFQRMYSPFDHRNHMVVVGHSATFVEYITEWAVNDRE